MEPNWTQHPEKLTREQLICALECVDNLLGDYASGDGAQYMSWEDLDATFNAVLPHFQDVYDEKLAKIEAELNDEEQ